MLRTKREAWSGAFRRILERLEAEHDALGPVELKAELKHGADVILPLPAVSRDLPLGLHGGIDLEELARQPDPRILGWGWNEERPIVTVRRSPHSATCWYFWAADRCHARLNERVTPDGEVVWELRAEAKARELYADGLEQWMTRWLGLWSWLLTGIWSLPETSRLDGWTCTQLHLNSDFVQLDLCESDHISFLGPRTIRQHVRPTTDEEAEALVDDESASSSSPWTETLDFGQRESDVALCIYRKGVQLRKAKRVEPQESMYAPLWFANGWDPAVDGDPLRVEWRLRKKGLRFQDAERTRTVYDLRDPALLLDPEVLDALWSYLCSQRRLVILGTHTRRKNCDVDPRWEVVKRASPVVVPPDIRQIPHEVRAKTRDERLASSLWGAMRVAMKYASENGLGAFDERVLGDVLVTIGHRVRSGEAAELINRMLATKVTPDTLKAGAARARAAAVFHACESALRFLPFCGVLEKHGGAGNYQPLFNRERCMALYYLWGNAPPMEDRPVSEQEHEANEKIKAAEVALREYLAQHEYAEGVLFDQLRGAFQARSVEEAETAGIAPELVRASSAALIQSVSMAGPQAFDAWVEVVKQRAFPPKRKEEAN